MEEGNLDTIIPTLPKSINVHLIKASGRCVSIDRNNVKTVFLLELEAKRLSPAGTHHYRAGKHLPRYSDDGSATERFRRKQGRKAFSLSSTLPSRGERVMWRRGGWSGDDLAK